MCYTIKLVKYTISEARSNEFVREKQQTMKLVGSKQEN